MTTHMTIREFFAHKLSPLPMPSKDMWSWDECVPGSVVHKDCCDLIERAAHLLQVCDRASNARTTIAAIVRHNCEIFIFG